MTNGLAKYLNRERIIKEFWGLFRYGIVGGASTLIFFGTYTILWKYLLPAWNRTLLDAIAICVSGIFNFTLHRTWTFRASGFNLKMVGRYIFTVVFGSGLQVLIFFIGHQILGFYDYGVQIVAIPLVALAQYFLHRFFTFHPRFEGTIAVTETHERTIGAGFEERIDSVQVTVEDENGRSVE